MSCTPVRPCNAEDPVLALVPPPPGLRRLARRVGGFDDFVAALVRDVEQATSGWDVEGDPRAQHLARLWAYVAEGVAAYSELTAGESYLGTAQDWTDLRRLAALVGYRPRPRVAAQGWVRVDTDKGASPLVPAGTRVQAPAVPGRDAQPFEVIEDTQLRADWAGLTATPVPQPAEVVGRTLRFLTDPGFRAGDRVLFVDEEPPAAPPEILDWFAFWGWLMGLTFYSGQPPSSVPVAVARVAQRASDLGTVLVTFDRDLDQLLPGLTKSYAAYRILATAGSARRLSKVVKLGLTTDDDVSLDNFYDPATPVIEASSEGSSVILDAALDDVSPQQLVALVDWTVPGGCDIVPVTRHTPVEWEVAPGAPTRVSRLSFAGEVGTLARAEGTPVTAYVVDRRVAARHYEIPDEVTGNRLRVYPAPDAAFPPPRIALRLAGGSWQVLDCAATADQEELGGDPSTPRGLILDLIGAAPAAAVGRAPASANLARVRHGTTTASTLGSGEAGVAGQAMPVPKAPVTADVAGDGSVVSSLEVRVDGLRWDELPTLFGAGPAQVYRTTLAADGAVTVEFGDGEQGSRVPTGRNNVRATYRVGGGTAGELPSGAISALIGSIRGVKAVAGVGPTSGGADQDDERRLRALVPGRASVFGRAVSRGDLADLARTYPGVSHATAWRGVGPPGCAGGGSGEHVAFLRAGSTGPRAPVADEIAALAAFLDARRDPDLPLCVCAGVVTAVAVAVSLAADPRAVPTDVAGAVLAALSPDGPLDPLERLLGQPLDRSDVLAVVHAVPLVVGVLTLTMTLGTATAAPIGRVPAQRYELFTVSTPTVLAVSA